MQKAPNTSPLIGHDDILMRLKHAFDTGHLHHALLLSGSNGIGKATLAYHLARYALGGESAQKPDHPTFRKIAAGSHPNIITLEPAFDEKKQRYKTEFTVDQALKIIPFLRQTAVDGQWRFVIIDRAHTMNRNAQNAILKVLEEPPAKTVLMLLSENNGAFLPTILSRCQVVPMHSLRAKDVHHALTKRYADRDIGEITRYAALAGGSLGRAINLIEIDALDVFDEWVDATTQLAHNNEKSAMKFCQNYGGSGKDQEYDFIQFMTVQQIETVIKSKLKGSDISDKNSLWHNHLMARDPKWLMSARDKLVAMFDTGNASYLDRKLILLNALQAVR